LGLYISKHRFYCGKIWENNQDKGAVFCFKIPVIKTNETEKKPLLQAKVPFEPQKLKNTCCRR
jgi:hypothetical protein